MNGFTFFIAVTALGFMVAIWWALAADRLDELDTAHLLHGPNDGCQECEDK